MSEDLIVLLDKSSSVFLKGLFPSADEMSRGRKTTLAAQFQRQLSTLVGSLEATEPHYIRCIKPNRNKAARLYDGAMVHEQLRYGNVIHVTGHGNMNVV